MSSELHELVGKLTEVLRLNGLYDGLKIADDLISQIQWAAEKARRPAPIAVLYRFDARPKLVSRHSIQLHRPDGQEGARLAWGSNQDGEVTEQKLQATLAILDEWLGTPAAAENSIAHSDDFRSVRWCERDFSFTPNQAACIKQLYHACTNGTPDVGDDTLLESADSQAKRLRDVFKGHPAWNTLIVTGLRKGTHRLCVKQKSSIPPKSPTK